MSEFSKAEERLLRERCERLLKLIHLRAPQVIVESSASLLIRGVICAVGAGALRDLGKAIIFAEKEIRGICPFCPEERPTIKEISPSGLPWGMCAECLKSVQQDDALAAALNEQEDA